MTESSWPFENADTSETQYSYLLRNFGDTGVLGTPGGTELKPYADSSGMFVRLPPGFAIIRGYIYYNDDVKVMSIGSANSSARVDTLVLRLDPAANVITAVVKAGQPGGGAPALTQTDTGVYELRLSDIAVGANATTVAASNTTDRRTFSSAPWGRWTNDTRPSGVSEGKAGYNFSTKNAEFWDGSNWRSIATGATTDAGLLTSGILPNGRLDYGVMKAARGDRGLDAPMGSDNFTVNGDWDRVYEPGMYRIFAGNTNQNSPGARFASVYLYGTLAVFGAGNGIQSRTQMYFEHGGNGRVYARTAWNGNDWNAWRWLASQEDLQAVASRFDNVYDKGAIDAAFTQRDQAITGANNNANNRTLNRGNASLLVAGAGTVSNFTKDANTGMYIGTLDIGIGGFNQVIACHVTPNSADSGGVTGQVTNQSNTGFRAVITRRNAANTYFYWSAIGN